MNTTLELTTSPQPDLVGKNIAPIDVDKLDTAKPLVEIFAPYQTTLEKWEAKAASLVVTDISQKAEMKQARIARLELRDARCTMKETKLNLTRHLKERAGKIDSTEKFFRDRFDALEAKLLESEEFAERYAAKVKTELKVKREAELLPFLDSPLVVDLSDMTERGFIETLNAHKVARQAKIDAAAKAEADRLAKEASDRAERERIAAENARLKAEAAETARLAEIEFKRIADERAKEKAAADAEREKKEAEYEAERLKAKDARMAELRKFEAQRTEDEAKARKEREAIQAAADAEMKKAAALRLAERTKAEDAARKAREETDRLNAELTAKSKAEAAEKAHIESKRVAAPLKDEAAFALWWRNEGSAMHPTENEDAESHCHRVSKIAWLNGAFKAREL